MNMIIFVIFAALITLFNNIIKQKTIFLNVLIGLSLTINAQTGWSLTGNATTETQFIGTTNNTVNNQENFVILWI